MEDMVPELQSYVSQGYFSKEETRTIASARRDHEYRLKRRAPLLPDFLRYIEYESAVAELVRSRRRAMPRADRPKKALADRAGDRRIHFVYARACRKFRGDLSLWSSWLGFCARSGSRRRGGRVAASALALHPREPALWAAAAAWEYGGGSVIDSEGGGGKRRRAKDAGSNPAAARALMQRGLRACGGASGDPLWAEYLRLELAYAATLRARREVLGVASGGKESEEKKRREKGSESGGESTGESESDDEELALSDTDGEGAEEGGAAAPASKRRRKKEDEPTEGAAAAAAAETAPPAGGEEADAATRAVLDGHVAAVVARSAVAADPGNLGRRLRLLSTLQGGGGASAGAPDIALLSLPGARRAAAELYAGLAEDFPGDPRARAALARRAVAEATLRGPPSPASGESALRESLAAFDAAVSELPVEGMFDELVSFLRERLAEAQRDAAAEGAPKTPATPPPRAAASRRGQGQQQRQAPSITPSTTIELLNKRLERACAAAAEAGLASEGVLLEWPQAALRRCRVRAALEAAERATRPSSSSSSAAPSSSAAVWRARLALMGTLAAASSKANGNKDENLWAQLARATAEGAAAVEAAEARKSSAAAVGAAAAAAPLWREAFSAIARAAPAETGSKAASEAASEAFEKLSRGLAASILASPCSPDPRGGLGGAAAAALAAAEALGGGGGDSSSSAAPLRRALADLLLSPGRPSPGGDFFDSLLRAEVAEALALQRESEEGGDGRQRKASAAAAAAASVDRFVEAALAAPTARDDPRPWLHYLRWEQERRPAGKGVGRVHWRAGKALRGEAAEEFASASSG